MLYCDCWLVCLPGLPVGGLRARAGLTHHYTPSPWHRAPHCTNPRTSSERICESPALLVRGVFGGKQATPRLPVAHWTPSLRCKLGSFPGQWGCSEGLGGGVGAETVASGPAAVLPLRSVQALGWAVATAWQGIDKGWRRSSREVPDEHVPTWGSQVLWGGGLAGPGALLLGSRPPGADFQGLTGHLYHLGSDLDPYR